MNKKIRVEITPTGEIRAKTLGMKGEECLDYVDLVERVLEARTVDSSFTEEYEEVRVDTTVHEQQELKKE